MSHGIIEKNVNATYLKKVHTMKITKKVKYILIAVWIFSLLIMTIGTLYIGKRYMDAVYGNERPTNALYKLKDPVMEIYQNLSDFRGNLNQSMQETPEIFMDEDYLRDLNRKSRAWNTYVVVKVDDEYLFSGIGTLDEELKKQLEDESSRTDAGQETDQERETGFSEFILQTPNLYLCNQKTCYTDGHRITISLLTYYGNYIQQFRRTVIRYVILMLLLMFILSAVISVLVYRQFVKPLVKLKDAVDEIGAGNLDVDIEIDHNRRDEIGELYNSLEDMRQRLSETVNLKMQYEAENRELISNISHDLKTPITTIKGYVEGIMDGVADTPEKKERYLKMVYNKANELDVLINELSLYTNINNNAIPYEFHRVLVKDYFQDCMEEVQATLMSHNMTLTYKNYCHDDVRVVVDPDQLKRVINNIVMNAIKYSDKEQGKVEIYIHEEGDMVKISICDNGKGIEEENLSHVFDRTFREDSARRSSGGSGLGLAICKKIVEEHGGTIWARSQKGYGTTILFTLKKYIKEESIDE